MQTFTIGLGRLWWFRVLGRNPLVRGSDRIEVLVLSLAVLVTVVAMPVAATFGTSVHDARTRLYAEQAQTRHQVTATAVEEAVLSLDVESDTMWFTANASWSVAGRDHVGTVTWPAYSKRGDQQVIWVDDAGKSVPAPPSQSRADTDAVGIALTMWLGAAAASAGLVFLVRRRLDHRRYREWDRVITASRNNDGQANRQ
ncbi:Rv1733c family protein [Mycobacterium sp. MMS18-G62]